MGCKDPKTNNPIFHNPLPLGGTKESKLGKTGKRNPENQIFANSPYGRSRGKGPHGGCDMRASIGTPIYATVSGKVTIGQQAVNKPRSGGKGGAGYYVTIEDDSGVKHQFMHMSKEGYDVAKALAGKRVEGGTQIGFTGTTGIWKDGKKDHQPHLHYETREKNEKGKWVTTNPMPYLNPESVTLDPVSGRDLKKTKRSWRDKDPEKEKKWWKEKYNARCAALGGVPDDGPTTTPSPAPTSTPTTPSQKEEEVELLEAGEESRNARRFQEQCFLMDNFQFFTVTDGVGQYGRLYPTSSNFVVLGGGNPQTLVSKMLMPKNMKGLMDLKPHEFASYVPYIKLFKVFYPSETSSGEEYELKFKNHLTNESLESMIKTGKGRGSGVGIKNFHWELAGSNVEEAERLIKAELTLYFQDLSDLVHRESLGEKNRNIGFIDLIHQENKFLFENSSKTSDCTVEGVGRRSYNNKYFRIKAHVGWSGPRGLNKEDRSKQELVSQTGYSFFLTMVRHEIDFKNDGTVELKIHYQAAMEGLLSSKRADILLMEENEELLKLEGQVKCIETSLSQIDLLETCNKITGEEAENMRSNWKKAMEG